MRYPNGTLYDYTYVYLDYDPNDYYYAIPVFIEHASHIGVYITGTIYFDAYNLSSHQLFTNDGGYAEAKFIDYDLIYSRRFFFSNNFFSERDSYGATMHTLLNLSLEFYQTSYVVSNDLTKYKATLLMEWRDVNYNSYNATKRLTIPTLYPLGSDTTTLGSNIKTNTVPNTVQNTVTQTTRSQTTNTGSQNTGSQNTGSQNTGSQNTGSITNTNVNTNPDSSGSSNVNILIGLLFSTLMITFY